MLCWRMETALLVVGCFCALETAMGVICGCWPAGETTVAMGDYLVQQGHRYGSGWLCASQSCPWITDMYVLVDVGYTTQCDNTAIKNITGRHDEARCCVPSLPAAGSQTSFKPSAWP